MEKAIGKLSEELRPTTEMSSNSIRSLAKEIASIGVESYTGALLRSCLAITEAVTNFAAELDNPSD